ncbi:MAG: hypothetical protein QOF74_7326 [Caballeronia mineralivorans]|jgi:hypothetical protein|nr:hypothetical protein [Caballeronia mineralivorans]
MIARMGCSKAGPEMIDVVRGAGENGDNERVRVVGLDELMTDDE